MTADAIDAYCKSSDDLAPYKRPKKYVFMDALPTNPSGKVLKRELLAAAS
ncbi:MAG: acyl-CoA synthetase (AMP-forming)/AMP-acid ligase II [Paracoccaceae bacterium]